MGLQLTENVVESRLHRTPYEWMHIKESRILTKKLAAFRRCQHKNMLIQRTPLYKYVWSKLTCRPDRCVDVQVEAILALPG